jgi:hypothetical protein
MGTGGSGRAPAFTFFSVKILLKPESFEEESNHQEQVEKEREKRGFVPKLIRLRTRGSMRHCG